MLADRLAGEATLMADDAWGLASRWRRDLARLGEPEPLSKRVAAHLAAADRGLEHVAQRYLAGQPTIVLVGDAKPLLRDLERAFPGRPLRVYDSALRPTR
jgi:hypothetical protein